MFFRTAIHLLACLALLTAWLVAADSIVEAQTATKANEQNNQAPVGDAAEDATRRQQREENLKFS